MKRLISAILVSVPFLMTSANAAPLLRSTPATVVSSASAPDVP